MQNIIMKRDLRAHEKERYMRVAMLNSDSIICSASHPFSSHLLHISSVLRLIYSASHLFRLSVCASSVSCPTYSVSQDLDHFLTLGSCLNFKPRLGMNHAWQELRREQKYVYRENSTSCLLKSLMRSYTQFNLFIDEIFARPFDNNLSRRVVYQVICWI